MDNTNLNFGMDNLSLSEKVTQQQETTEEELHTSNIKDEKDKSETESATSSWEYNSEPDHNGSPVQEVPDTRQCPLSFSNPCNWSGPIENPEGMIKHCLQAHPKNIFVSDNQKLTVSRFNELVPRKYYILFCELDNIFRLTWDLNVTTRLMRFGVYFLYDFELDVEYVFEIDFLHARKKVIKLKGPCYHLENEDDIFLEKIYFTLPYDMMKNYCDSEGSLTFTVKIYVESLIGDDF